MRIDSLATKDGSDVKLGKLTVLVGPNNVGKSRTLRDIQELVVNGAAAPTTLVKDIRFAKPASFDDILQGIDVRQSTSNVDNSTVRGIGSNLRSGETFEIHLKNSRDQFVQSTDLKYLLGNLAKFHVSYLDAGSRLQVSQSSPSHDAYNAAPSTLLQALYIGRDVTESKLRDAFQKTFGMDIRLDYAGMQNLMLRVAKTFPDLPADPRDQIDVLRRVSLLDQQGDGFRSFVGVVLSVLLSEGRIILLDEPEAFLHPMQARRLGAWLATQVAAGTSQVLVATHNANFLAGILSSGSEVSIYRLNRTDDHTEYNLIAAETVAALSRSPVLSSQRVLEAIFYKGVVVCEADADRAVYESVANRAHDNRNVLFVHAHNKQTIKTVVELLKKATIPVCAIADIDILNSSTDFRSLLASLAPAAALTQLLERRDIVAKVIDGRPEAEILQEITTEVAEFNDQLQRGEHTVAGARGALSRIETSGSKWGDVKAKGVDGVPQQVRHDAEWLLEESKKLGLLIPSVGELEGWLSLGVRKNKWIVLALEKIGKGEAGDKLTSFVEEVLKALD